MSICTPDGEKAALIAHYDALVDEENDPFRDPEPLRAYMDLWDGESFLALMDLDGAESVLEIGAGTGRLGASVIPLCRRYTGIDLSPKTVARALENLADASSAALLCEDLFAFSPPERYDVIYSSLTFFHIRDKAEAMKKIAALLAPGGRFVLSISKDTSSTLDYGTRRLPLYPDTEESTLRAAAEAPLHLTARRETENALLFRFEKQI